jgi:hypothetical protein
VLPLAQNSGEGCNADNAGIEKQTKKTWSHGCSESENHPISSIIQYVAFTLADWVSKQV